MGDVGHKALFTAYNRLEQLQDGTVDVDAEALEDIKANIGKAAAHYHQCMFKLDMLKFSAPFVLDALKQLEQDSNKPLDSKASAAVRMLEKALSLAESDSQ